MDRALQETFNSIAPEQGYCSLRLVREVNEYLHVRQDVLQPVNRSESTGGMVTVIRDGGLGYAATSDLSEGGLKKALARAEEWARRSASHMVFDTREVPWPHPKGEYSSTVINPWEEASLEDRCDILFKACKSLNGDERIVEREAVLWNAQVESLFLTNGGGEVRQNFSLQAPFLSATAWVPGGAQTRTLGGHGAVRQGGMEVLDQVGFLQQAPQVAEEALQLIEAEDCPNEVLDVVLMPDQMILQIHEAIGHPLELDRILGDERNYAGTSFVKVEDFGSLQYGSDLLNVTFDPEVPGEFASYAFDDEGRQAEKVFLIENGTLKAGLGGEASQNRSGVPGVANSRACSWNRPPIDRMANINLEAGDSTLDEMVASIDRGVLMKTNRSWSIDQSRNKFQFGCEWGQMIEDGKLTKVVKNPNYRGVSSSFWKKLSMVGNQDTVSVMGSPFCGKGEPNQVIRVGHSSPACKFSSIDVFGGAK